MDENHSKARQLLEEAYRLSETDIDRARQLAEESRQLISDSSSKEKSQADIIIAEWCRQRGQYTDAVVAFLSAIETYDTFEEDDWLLFALYRLGMVYTLINYHTDALEVHWRQYRLAKKFDNHVEMGNALRRIGWAYYELHQDDRAIEHHIRSLEEFQSIDNKVGIAGVYNNLALLYQHMGNIALALDYAQKAIGLFEESAYLRGQMLGQGTITSILTDAGDLETAKVHAERNLALAKELKIHHNIIHAHLNVGKLYVYRGEVEKAFEYYQEAYELAYQEQDIVAQKLCHQHLSEFFKSLSDYEKAFEHFQIFHELEIITLQNANEARIEIQALQYQAKQAQAELSQQKLLRQEEHNHYEKLTQMKDELISTASHDLKNPLANIKVMTYLLSGHLKDMKNARVQEIIKQIDESVERMRSLISNVLDLARLETNKTLEFQSIQLADYLQSVINEFKLSAEQKNIQISLQKPDEDIATTIDPQQIQQVLRNLLSNALKYTDNGEIVVSFHQIGEQVQIRVQDTGSGISQEDLPRIFDRFYRGKAMAHQAVEGTGLGLAICKSIVEQHHGTITVESTEGKGSSFVVTMPLSAA